MSAVSTNPARRFTALQHYTDSMPLAEGRAVSVGRWDPTGTDCNQEAALGTPKGMLQLLPSPRVSRGAPCING